MNLDIEAHIFDSSTNVGGSGLTLTAKRYTSRISANTRGLTLMLAHGIGSHKEQWETVLHRIFEQQQQQHKDEAHRIREAWSFDRQNHGDAALINKEILKDLPDGVPVSEWAHCITDFLRSPRMKGHRIVPLGHSVGTCAFMLATEAFPLRKPPYVALVLIETSITIRELYDKPNLIKETVPFVIENTMARRIAWSSRDEAFNYLKQQLPWKSWDHRVIRSLTEHGLYDTPSGVAFEIDNNQEAVCYNDTETRYQFVAAEQYALIGRYLPVHFIWGARHNLIPGPFKKALADASKGYIAASVTMIKGGGHMIVQERPDEVADVVCQILDTVINPQTEQARL